MESKKEITSNVFYYLSKEIENELCLGYINNVQNIDFDCIKIKIHKKKTQQLIITKEILFLAGYDIQIMNKSLEFTRYLKKKLNNQRIHEIKQNKHNKVIYFRLDDYYLIFEFFSNTNIVLTNEEFIVISARRYERWKDRQIIRNKKYEFPKCDSVFDISKTDIEEINKLDKKEKIKYFVKKHNIAPYYLNKVFEKKEDIKDIKKLFEYEFIKLKKINNVFVIEENTEKETIEDLSKTIEKEYLSVFLESGLEKEKKTKDKKIKVILDIQEKKQKEFENKVSLLKKEAEIIYTYFNTVEEINKQINLAIQKKINKEEIIKKINDYFEKTSSNLKIKDINLKEKKYTLEIKD